jgi:hypothetical protein
MRRLLAIISVALFCASLWCFAQAQNIIGSGIYGDAKVSAPSFSLTYKTNGNFVNSCCGGVTLVDYGTKTWGAGCNGLVLAVTFGGSSTPVDVSSISIGGSGGTGGVGGSEISGSLASNTAIGGYSTIWQTSGAPSGSSGDVGVSFTGATGQFTVDITTAIYCLVSTHLTGVGASNFENGQTSVSEPIAVPTGGVGIAAVGVQNNGTVTLTNGTLDVSVGVNNFSYFAHTTGTGTVTITASGPNTDWELSEAAWGP